MWSANEDKLGLLGIRYHVLHQDVAAGDMLDSHPSFHAESEQQD